ncbi:MAG: hypothetical protein WBI07_05535 [Mobilitalea sp.]
MKPGKFITTVLIIILTVIPVIFIGCSTKDKSPIVTINGKELYIDDFLYDIYIIEKEGNIMEAQYQSKLGYSYWDFEYEGNSIRKTAKSSILTRVIMNQILADQATLSGISITQNEASDIKQSIESLYRGTSKEDLDAIGLTRKVLESYYRTISLSHNYYLELSKDFNINEDAIRKSINKEDYREYDTECIFIPTVTSDPQTVTALSEEEAAKALQTISDALLRIKDGIEFDTILNENSSFAYYSRDFVYNSSRYEKEYQEVAVQLASNEYSGVVSGDYGYYIIHMLDNSSSTAYEKAVKDAIATEEAAQFSLVYDAIKKTYPITIDFDYWDSLMIGSITTSNN